MRSVQEAVSAVATQRTEIYVRTFRDTTPEDVLALLKTERFTGNMTINFSQGGVCNIHVEARTHLTSK